MSFHRTKLPDNVVGRQPETPKGSGEFRPNPSAFDFARWKGIGLALNSLRQNAFDLWYDALTVCEPIGFIGHADNRKKFHQLRIRHALGAGGGRV